MLKLIFLFLCILSIARSLETDINCTKILDENECRYFEECVWSWRLHLCQIEIQAQEIQKFKLMN